MSTTADAGAAIVALYDTLRTEGYCSVSASVLFIYASFGMLDREVACFWTARWTGALLLFLANKWIPMTVYVMTLVQFASFASDESCSVFQIVNWAANILGLVPAAVFSALRVFVLSRSKLLGLLVLVLSLSPAGINLVKYNYQVSGENVPPYGCIVTANTTSAIDLSILTQGTGTVVILSRTPLIIADVIIVCVTWTKLRTRGILKGIYQSKRLSLSDILFRDGTIYFVVLFILNILHLVLSVTALAGVATTDTSYVTIFTGPLTAILISRFLLDLQEANQSVVRVDPDDPLQTSRDPYSTPSFISSLGGFINPEHSAQSDNEHE